MEIFNISSHCNEWSSDKKKKVHLRNITMERHYHKMLQNIFCNMLPSLTETTVASQVMVEGQEDSIRPCLPIWSATGPRTQVTQLRQDPQHFCLPTLRVGRGPPMKGQSRTRSTWWTPHTPQLITHQPSPDWLVWGMSNCQFIRYGGDFGWIESGWREEREGERKRNMGIKCGREK